MIPETGIPQQPAEVALDTIMGIGEIVYAAVWLDRSNDEEHPVLECVGVRPEGTSVRESLSPAEERLGWVLQTPAFNWTVSGSPVGRRGTDERPCAYVMFALDRKVLLEVCVLGKARVIASRIDRIHAALAGFSRSLSQAARGGATDIGPAEGIDLEFVEAAAMGDRQFVRQILDIAAEEIVEGVSSLRDAAGRVDREAVRFQAHRIRSTARTVGASSLDTRMAALESACVTSTPVDGLVRDGIEEAESVLQALKRATRRP